MTTSDYLEKSESSMTSRGGAEQRNAV